MEIQAEMHASEKACRVVELAAMEEKGHELPGAKVSEEDEEGAEDENVE